MSDESTADPSLQDPPSGSTGLRCGTVALIGRPNAGKSTLMNRLLDEKLAIVSDKPQTTRHRLIGILSDDAGQVVFFDTPGVHKPLHRLNRQMLQHALDALNDADVVCLLVDASKPFGAGDAYLLDLIAKSDRPRLLCLNKVDRVRKPDLLPIIERYAEAGLFEEIIPISALRGDGTEAVLKAIRQRLPESEPMYDPELLTVHPDRFLAAEQIREHILHGTRDELPFSTAVKIEKWEEVEAKGLTKIWAAILVERPGQKKIIIGRGGSMIKQIGTAARKDLEAQLGRKVYLDLHVRHEPGWRESRRLLAELDREIYGRIDPG